MFKRVDCLNVFFARQGCLCLARSKQVGFSLLELTVVIIVIAALLFVGVKAYFPPIKKSQIESLRYQASAFSRTVNNLRASSLISNAQAVVLSDKTVYLNEKGWPANTHKKMSAKSWNQTPEECQQLWNALYEIPPESILNISEKKVSSHYLISSINGRICRYELLRKQDGIYFFDYHLNTGKVITQYPNS